MSEYVGIRIDRNFLLLSAIYAIHCFLLHVFVQPINVTMNENFLSKINYTNFNIEINGNYDQSDKNSSDSRTRIFDDDIVIAHHQAISKKAGLKFLAASKMPENSLIILSKCTTMTVELIKSITPATWGIISGCIVFLLTFTDNVH